MENSKDTSKTTKHGRLTTPLLVLLFVVLIVVSGISCYKAFRPEGELKTLHPAVSEYYKAVKNGESVISYKDLGYLISTYHTSADYKSAVYFPTKLFEAQSDVCKKVEENPNGIFVDDDCSKKTAYDFVIVSAFYNEFSTATINGFIRLDNGDFLCVTISKEDMQNEDDDIAMAFVYGEKIVRMFYNFVKEE